jgi:uncharacterized protein (DUF1501 family)
MSFNRRSFIRYASLAAAGNVAGFRPFGMMNSLAASTTDYKALVCIFLFGGNDSNNTLVPYDTTNSDITGYANYQKIRGPLAIPKSVLLQLKQAPEFSLHPSLPEMQTLFNNGNAAIVANVGTLMQPLTPTQFQSGNYSTPSNLFSHPDQQLEWQNAAQSGATSTGWAGRIADNMGVTYNGTNPPIPFITSVDGDTLFCNGVDSSPVAVTPGNLQGGQCSEGPACSGRLNAATQMIKFSSGLSLVQADNAITQNAYQYMTTLADAVSASKPLSVGFPQNNPLGAQLQQVAQIIGARQSLGLRRQIFFAGVGNFDTHANQLLTQAGLLSMISPAISAFYAATQEMGVANDVTSFTMSDFSRAFQPNSNSGSDHAWGGHHFVIGGAVNGGAIYGTPPTLSLAGPNDSGTNGRWVPTTASVQYAATLASWFGVQAGDLSSIFPTLPNFGTTFKPLGFVG